MLLPVRLTKSTLVGRVPPLHAADGLTVEVIDNLNDLTALQSDYERLLPLSGNTLPFALHEWHVTWCSQFLESGKHLQTHPMIYIVRDSNRLCVGIVPLIMTRRAIGPVQINTLDLLGADPAITEIRTSIIQPSYETRVIHAIQKELSALRSVAWVSWGSVGDSHVAALAAGSEIRYQEPLLDYILDLPPTWDLFRANLPHNIRESIRHGYNSLRREALAFELRVARQPGAVKDALERFFELHRMRAALKSTVTHPDYFAAERPRVFLREVCARLAARDKVRIFQLAIGGEVIAARVGFLVGNSLYLYYSGYDPRWAKRGVMTTTLVETIKYAIGQRCASINLSPGKDQSKLRWRPREVALAQAVQINTSPFSKLAWRGFQRVKGGRPLPQWIVKLVRHGVRDWG